MTEAPPAPPYLGTMLAHLARVGDELSQLDRGPGEGLNYFATLQQHPSTLLPQLMLQEVRLLTMTISLTMLFLLTMLLLTIISIFNAR